MNRYREIQPTEIHALKRVISSLINKGDLNYRNTEKVYSLATTRGISDQVTQELILDCQVEYNVD
ncbi:MAG: hypothetical protein WBA74_20625 [Cyclobacteriaceae bacterium]